MGLVFQADMQALKKLLGRRRFRVGVLSQPNEHGRSMTQGQIARVMKIHQSTVSRDLAYIERLKHAVRGGALIFFPGPQAAQGFASAASQGLN